MIKVIAVIGKSASGKDYLVESALTTFPKLNPVIHYTTRPKRDNEKEGIDYFFIKEKDLNNLPVFSDTVFNNWHYILGINSFKKDKINIGVFNLQELKYLIENYSDGFKIQVIYLLADDKVRYERSLKRLKNPFDEEGLTELIRREKADSADFSIENLKGISASALALKSNKDIANAFNLGTINGLLYNMGYYD